MLIVSGRGNNMISCCVIDEVNIILKFYLTNMIYHLVFLNLY